MSPVNRNERRMAIARMIAVGELPCWTIGVMSIDWMDWLVEVWEVDIGKFLSYWIPLWCQATLGLPFRKSPEK